MLTVNLIRQEVLAERRAKYRAWTAASAKRHPERLRARSLMNYYKTREEQPELILLYQARGRARRAGIPCTLHSSDIAIPAVCPVLGICLERGNRMRHDGSPTLDRFDPALGYVPGNVSVISHRANRLKSDASLAELEVLVAWMKEAGRGG